MAALVFLAKKHSVIVQTKKMPRIQVVSGDQVKKMLESKHADFAVFFSLSTCGHCIEVRPILTEVAKAGIPIVELECNDKNNSQFVSTQNILGVPEIRRYTKDGKTTSFNGDRTKAKLAKFLKRTV